MSIFFNPVNVVVGIGCFEMFLNDVRAMQGNILIVTGNKSAENIEPRIRNAIKTHKNQYMKGVKSNPDIADIYTYYKNIKSSKFNPDYILAIGGGSVLDTAKALKALLGMDIESDAAMKREIEIKGYTPLYCPLIFCPTSAGSGSELTKWATIWNKKDKEKYSIEHHRLYADKVYIDPELTCTVPVEQSVYCAFDAFSHAVESYWSPKSCKISREYSIKAIEIFSEAMDSFLESCDIHKREMLSLCSYFAGLAFSHTKTSVCHAISYPLTMIYGVPHGIAACISIPDLFEINSGHIVEEYRLMKAFGVSDIQKFKQKIHSILEKADIPFRLSDYGFQMEQVDSIAEKCLTPGRIDNNPVTIKIDDIKRVLYNL